MPLYLKGQAGKALDDTLRLLGVDLVATSATLRLESLAADALRWLARTADIEAGETILPEHEQIVELWQDSTRIFRGWVSDPRARNHGVQVTVEGPWYWLRKIQLSTALTGLVNTADRPTVIFNEATVTSMITTLLTRAMALGAPFAIGTIDATYAVHKQQHTAANFADVLAALVRQVPDAVVWWNYSGTGVPTFNLTRRGSMATTTFTVGAGEMTDHDAALYPSRVPSRVELPYMSRASTFGYPQFSLQAAGTAVTGRVQQIPISGRELAPFLPKDNYESYTVQTYNANLAGQALKDRILAMLPEVAASRAAFPNYPRSSDVELAEGEDLKMYRAVTTSSGAYQGFGVYTQPPFQCVDYDTGLPVSRVGKKFVISELPPEWAQSALANLQRVKLYGRIYHLEKLTNHNFTGTSLVITDVENIPAWVNAFGWSNDYDLVGFYAPGHSSTTRNPTNGDTIRFFELNFEIEAYLTTTNLPAATTLYKPQDYDYTAPASGQAAALLAAQNFVPVDGHIDLKATTSLDFTNRLNRLYNIAGGMEDLETMAAMPKAVVYDLAQRTTRIELGSPARFDFGARAGGQRGTAQANITL